MLAPVTGGLHVVTVKDGQFISGEKLFVYDTDDALIRKSNLKDQLSFTQKALVQNLELKATEREALLRNLAFKDIVKRYAQLTQAGASSELNLLSQEKSLEDTKTQLVRLDQQIEQLRLQYSQRIRTIKSELQQITLLLENSIVSLRFLEQF